MELTGRRIDSSSSGRLLARWALIFLFLGILWRLLRFALAVPLCLDEQLLGFNVVSRSFEGLLQPLDYSQVAPIGFLLLLRLQYGAMGFGDYAARLPSIVFGTCALWLFWDLAKRMVSPAAAVFAVGIASVSISLVHLATQMKPYASDLFCAVALLWLGAHYFRSRNLRWLIALIFAIPICTAMSYPAVFVEGGIAIALLGNVRRDDWVRRALVGLYCVLLCAGFSAMLLLFASGQYTQTAGLMLGYWRRAFPPANPLLFPLWLTRVQVSSAFAYPLAGVNGAGLVTLILCVIGVRATWKQWSAPIRLMVVSPFVLTIIAAALHRYPYGHSWRIVQHLAPAVMLLAGAGLGGAIDAARDRIPQHVLINVAGVALFGIAIAGIFRDVASPCEYEFDQQTRDVARGFVAVSGDVPAYVLNSEQDVPFGIRWYLRERSRPVVYGLTPSTNELTSATNAWLMTCVPRNMHDDGPGTRAVAILAHDAGMVPKIVRQDDVDVSAHDATPTRIATIHLTRDP